MRISMAATALAFAAAPAGVHAVDYLTAEQAQALIFPDADHFESRPLSLDAARMQALSAAGVSARSSTWQLRLARRGTTPLGYVVLDKVIGKAELIDYAVGIAMDGTVRQIEILAYREGHGQEVRLPAWRRQFVGKGPTAPIRVNDDIANISGATLSCTHLTEGVRRIVAVLAAARQAGDLAP